MSKIRILYMVSTLRKTGPTNQLLGMVKYLDREKFQPFIVTLSPEVYENSEKGRFENLDIPLFSLELGRIKGIFLGLKKLENVIEKVSPHIIHAAGLRTDSLLSRISHKKIITCTTLHNFVFEDYVFKYGKLIGNFIAKRHIANMEKLDYLICCSGSIAKMYERCLKHSVLEIQNGIELNKYVFNGEKSEQVSIREKFGISLDKTVFIVSGSLSKRKNPSCIIRAFLKAKVEKEAELIVVGDGPLLEECKNIGKDQVRIFGRVEDVDLYLKASDICISASNSEGLPMAILEAGASGLRLLLSNIDQHKEITNGLEGGIDFFPCNDEEILCEKIKETIKMKNELERETISNYFSSKFGAEKMSKRYQNFYIQIENETKIRR